MPNATAEYVVTLRSSDKHPNQAAFINSLAKRKIVRAGRRGGKTVGAATLGLKYFLKGKRVLYATPTTEQINRFWFEIKRALEQPLYAGVYYKNETEHFIEVPGTEQRIKAKTAWNSNTLRGDFCDILILDEWQLMDEDTWDEVGAPMLLDNDGDAVFIYTPPSLRNAGVSKARDPLHAAKMFKKAQSDTTGRWETFHFSSHENPFISKEALGEITKDMSRKAYQQEILAEDDEIESNRLVYSAFNDQICKIPRFDLPVTWPVYVGHDFGPANPAALFVAQNPETGLFFVFKEYLPGPQGVAYNHVQEWQKITEGRNVLLRVGGSPQEDEVRQLYATHGWPIAAPFITKVNPQVEKVQGFMEHNKIFVFDDMINYLDELYNCLWEVDRDNNILNDIRHETKYHLCACARYLFSTFRPETGFGNKFRSVNLLRER